MPTGQPIALKCPSCKRGKHGFPNQVKGVITAMHEKRERSVSNGRRRGRHKVIQRRATCLDCEYWWWTSHYDAMDRARAMASKPLTHKDMFRRQQASMLRERARR